MGKQQINIAELPPGIYGVSEDKTAYKIDLPVTVPVRKKVNIFTGEVIYPTHADNVKDMSIYELAHLFEQIENGAKNDNARGLSGWLEWLGQEGI